VIRGKTQAIARAESGGAGAAPEIGIKEKNSKILKIFVIYW
jgi:hypothetical protein